MGSATSNGPGFTLVGTNTDKASKDFQAAATVRDKQAAEYFGSDKFVQQMKGQVLQALVKSGDNFAAFKPDMKPGKQDLPLIQKAFLKVQADYPELNHIRISGGEVILDTRKNTIFRQILQAPLY